MVELLLLNLGARSVAEKRAVQILQLESSVPALA
jgi:hypothetical protein